MSLKRVRRLILFAGVHSYPIYLPIGTELSEKTVCKQVFYDEHYI